MKLLLIALLSLLLVAGLAQGQGVYVIQGKNGPIFTDQPQPGAKPVTLPPLNVATPPPAAAASREATKEVKETTKEVSKEAAKPAAKAAAEAPSYREFSIVWPEKEGSVLANTAIFEVRLAVDPPLLLGEGHAFAVSVNGRAVNQRFTATEFMIPPEFWGDAEPPFNQEMQLDAAIVDGSGRVLKSAAPVRFYMRHATLQLPRRPK